MKKNSLSIFGVSPILAILLLIAITLMIAGVTAVWVFSLLNNDHDTGGIYVFDIELYSSSDELILQLIDGDPFNTTDSKMLIDDIEITLTPVQIMIGSDVNITCGFDVIQGQEYTIKLVMNNKVVLYQEKVAL